MTRSLAPGGVEQTVVRLFGLLVCLAVVVPALPRLGVRRGRGGRAARGRDRLARLAVGSRGRLRGTPASPRRRRAVGARRAARPRPGRPALGVHGRAGSGLGLGGAGPAGRRPRLPLRLRRRRRSLPPGDAQPVRRALLPGVRGRCGEAARAGGRPQPRSGWRTPSSTRRRSSSSRARRSRHRRLPHHSRRMVRAPGARAPRRRGVAGAVDRRTRRTAGTPAPPGAARLAPDDARVAVRSVPRRHVAALDRGDDLLRGATSGGRRRAPRRGHRLQALPGLPPGLPARPAALAGGGLDPRGLRGLLAGGPRGPRVGAVRGVPELPAAADPERGGLLLLRGQGAGGVAEPRHPRARDQAPLPRRPGDDPRAGSRARVALHPPAPLAGVDRRTSCRGPGRRGARLARAPDPGRVPEPARPSLRDAVDALAPHPCSPERSGAGRRGSWASWWRGS